MKQLRLIGAYPSVFANSLPPDFSSEIWGQDITINKGDKILVRASSGRGKTSLCSFISCQRSDYVGDILIDGVQAASFSEEDKTLLSRFGQSYMYQDLKLFDCLNALENIKVRTDACMCSNMDRAVDMLEKLGLGGMLERPVKTLSWGQKQRLAFVRMICTPADFLILDEPVSHVDSAIAEKMGEMLRERYEQDSPAVIVTSVGYDFPLEFDRTFLL